MFGKIGTDLNKLHIILRDQLRNCPAARLLDEDPMIDMDGGFPGLLVAMNSLGPWIHTVQSCSGCHSGGHEELSLTVHVDRRSINPTFQNLVHLLSKTATYRVCEELRAVCVLATNQDSDSTVCESDYVPFSIAIPFHGEEERLRLIRSLAKAIIRFQGRV